MHNTSVIHSQLQRWLDAFPAEGSDAEVALNQLIDFAGERLTRLTRHMLRQFPQVRRWEQTDDVLQNALIRLVRALHDVRPTTVQQFFALASLQIRRQLIDLARHYAGPTSGAANYATPADRQRDVEPGDTVNSPLHLAQWAEFHAHVDRLPDDQKDVMDLIFYQGLTQVESARVLEVSVRTVQRRWHAALLALHPLMCVPDDG